MKIQKKQSFFMGIAFMIIFLLWTALVSIIDVQPIGPLGSEVGFSTWNGWFHRFTGVHMTLYIVTDALGFLPLLIVMGFALLGLFQWIQRKRFCLVDQDILLLGASYLITLTVFFLFELVVINYRPILIEGVLEASYPSSTTMLTMCVMPSAAVQFQYRIRHSILRKMVLYTISAFSLFMVMARLLSGVHWLTDIIGGALFSCGLFLLYFSLTPKKTI